MRATLAPDPALREPSTVALRLVQPTTRMALSNGAVYLVTTGSLLAQVMRLKDSCLPDKVHKG